MISRVGTSPHLAWFCALERIGRKTSCARSSKCSNGVLPPISMTITSREIPSDVTAPRRTFMNTSVFPFGTFFGITVSHLSDSGQKRNALSSTLRKSESFCSLSSVWNAFVNLGPCSCRMFGVAIGTGHRVAFSSVGLKVTRNHTLRVKGRNPGQLTTLCQKYDATPFHSAKRGCAQHIYLYNRQR